MRFGLCAAALLLAGCDAEAVTLDAATSAYSQNRVGEAEAALKRIAAEPTAKPADKAKAHRELARIAWLIDRDADKALGLLPPAYAAGEDRCETAILEARVLQEAQRALQLFAESQALVSHCTDPDEADRVRLEMAEAALDLAADPAKAKEGFIQAGEFLAAMGSDSRGGLRGSALSLQFALFQGDAVGALQAWRNYFWLSDSDMPQGLTHFKVPAAALFNAGLALDATAENRLQLIDLLVRSGFALEAERFAHALGIPAQAGSHPLWRKASGYFEARRELEATVLASNRSVARGGKAANLEAAVARANAKLMDAAALSGDPVKSLREAYGLYGMTGDTGGFASVHLGHIVQDERRAVEQYGHRADVAFLALDNMISNGFETWLWDGTAAAGGWADPGPVIVQVRREYTSGPLRGWRLFSGGASRQQLLGRQQDRAATDLAALRGKEAAYLPGLADRLRLQVADQVGAKARLLSNEGGDLRRAFLDEYWRAMYQQSMVTHEGRHALDRTLVRGLARLNDTNLEYRAKLSELALADYPRLALLNINSVTIGGGTPHGNANEQVLEAYAKWMGKNPAQIDGFDPAAPALIQVDKLSDEQIRTIARGLDPIAAGSP